MGGFRTRTVQKIPVVLFVTVMTSFEVYLNEKWLNICNVILKQFKGGINLNAIFPPLDMALMEISRSRFKQSKKSMLIP